MPVGQLAVVELRLKSAEAMIKVGSCRNNRQLKPTDQIGEVITPIAQRLPDEPRAINLPPRELSNNPEQETAAEAAALRNRSRRIES